jgi:hypothetical protein
MATNKSPKKDPEDHDKDQDVNQSNGVTAVAINETTRAALSGCLEVLDGALPNRILALSDEIVFGKRIIREILSGRLLFASLDDQPAEKKQTVT